MVQSTHPILKHFHNFLNFFFIRYCLSVRILSRCLFMLLNLTLIRPNIYISHTIHTKLK